MHQIRLIVQEELRSVLRVSEQRIETCLFVYIVHILNYNTTEGRSSAVFLTGYSTPALVPSSFRLRITLNLFNCFHLFEVAEPVRHLHVNGDACVMGIVSLNSESSFCSSDQTGFACRGHVTWPRLQCGGFRTSVSQNEFRCLCKYSISRIVYRLKEQDFILEDGAADSGEP